MISLFHDIATISDWHQVNRIDFNARKTQYYTITYRGSGENDSSPVGIGNLP